MENAPKNPETYSENDLMRDIQTWRQEQITKSESAAKEFESKSELDLFLSYTNNFTMAIMEVFNLLDEEGNLKDFGSSERNEFKREVAESLHLSDLYGIMKGLDYNWETIKSIRRPLNEEHKLIIKKIWIEMRKKGFSRLDLIG